RRVSAFLPARPAFATRLARLVGFTEISSARFVCSVISPAAGPIIAPSLPPVGTGQIHAQFLTVLPVVQRHAGFVFRHLNPTDREEAIAESVAAAFVSMVGLGQRGRDAAGSPRPPGGLSRATHA